MKLPSLRLESMLMLGTAILLGCVLLLAGVAMHYSRVSDSDWEYVRHTREVIQKLQEMKINLLELETSERGYLITGRDALLERNEKARGKLEKQNDDLAQLISDNPVQVGRTAEMRPLFSQRFESGKRLVTLRDDYGLGAAQPMIVGGIDQAQSNKIVSVMDQMLSEEYRLLDIRRAKFKSTLDARRDLTIVSGIVIFILVCALGWAIREDLHLRAKHVKWLDEIAHNDMLTGLSNRRSFTTSATSLLALAQRQERMTAVLMLDLDGFKNVNDTLGHEAGDMLLREVAQRLKQTVRNSDLVARLGGDEFVVFLPGFDSVEGVQGVAQKLLDSLCQSYVLETRQPCPPVDTSVGIAWSPDHGTDLNTLMRHADMALYEAKRAGKRQYAIYESRMSTS